MSKSVIGRNLGALLRGTKVSQPATTRTALDAAKDQTIGPGLRSLLIGAEAEEGSSRSDDLPKERFPFLGGFAAMPAWYFFGADLALLFLASVLVWPAVVAPATGKVVLAGMAVVTGTLLSIIPFVRPAFEGSPKEVLRKWVLATHGTGEAEKALMVHAHPPAFVGEVQRLPTGRVTVVPLTVVGSLPLSPTEYRRLAGEAADAYCEITARRGRQFRSSLL
jgi:hypothetical protein